MGESTRFLLIAQIINRFSKNGSPAAARGEYQLGEVPVGGRAS